MSFRVKIREGGKWREIARVDDFVEACDIYNESPLPRLLLGPVPGGIMHKQYSDNGFRYYGPDYREVVK
jgi:hypothetical protein